MATVNGAAYHVNSIGSILKCLEQGTDLKLAGAWHPGQYDIFRKPGIFQAITAFGTGLL
jgi:hypothetical protein